MPPEPAPTSYPNDQLITPKCIDNVVAFISLLESIPEEDIAHWPNLGKATNGAQLFSLEPEYAPAVRAVMQAFNANNFLQPFDWGRWQSTAEKIVREPARLSKASLKTCAKLITLHVRKDRFCGGHFGEMVRCGHITAILRRLAQLRKD